MIAASARRKVLSVPLKASLEAHGSETRCGPGEAASKVTCQSLGLSWCLGQGVGLSAGGNYRAGIFATYHRPACPSCS